MTSSHSVLVVDDQAPFRLAAKAVLRRMDGFELVGEAVSGPDAIEQVERLRPVLVLMDINMPEMSGIEATRLITAAHPDVVVFLCSTYDASDLPSGAAASGARGYLNKEQLGADTLRRMWEARYSAAPGAALLTEFG
ncbi:MAG TPA: response regulator transcription factor [Streptosporangiaceae bacterium]